MLLDKRWSLEIARKPRLITSDTPMIVRHQESYMDRFRGRGIVDAEEIRFPLGPGHQIVLTSKSRPATERIEPSGYGNATPTRTKQTSVAVISPSFLRVSASARQPAPTVRRCPSC
ncbi:hypothetical protein [Amycolatopsis albispora]|uniref:hypothetical protein n=1 Tax=Amycolatopsis albispora TaxID=1804986 RepID=UPI003AB0B317